MSDPQKDKVPQQAPPSPPPRGGGSEWVSRVRGLPWSCSTDDIIAFFEPVVQLDPQDVHIIREYDGRVSGQAFVELPDEDTRDSANTELHKKHIGDRYIELYKASREELDCYLRRSQGAPFATCSVSTQGKEVVRLRGLPFSTTDAQVHRWFCDHGYNLELSAIAIGYYPDGRMTGEAWVLVDDKQDVMSKLNKEIMGRRYIEVFPSMISEFEAAKMGSCTGSAYGGSRGANGPSMTPYGGYGGYRGNGYGNGNYNNMGGYGGGSSGNGAYSHQPPYGSPPNMYGNGYGVAPATSAGGGVQGDFTCLRLRGLPYHANENNIVEFFQGFHMKAILPSTVPVHNRPSGEAYVEFHGSDECMRAYRQKNGAMMDRRYIELFPSSKQEMDWAADGMDPREIRKRLGGR